MNSKTSAWLWTLGVAAAAGAATMYVKVKNQAVRHLARMGVFKEAQNERIDALQQVTGMNPKDLLMQSNDICSEGNDRRDDNILWFNPPDKNDKKWVDHPAVKKINRQFREKKQDIIEKHGASTFTGSWGIISPEERMSCLTSSAVNSMIAGGLTYAVQHAARNAKKGRGKGGNSGCGGGGGCGGHSPGHGCGSHGCGIGCGGAGCGGGS